MKKLLISVLFLTLFVAACGNANSPANENSTSEAPSPSSTAANGETSTSTTKIYKDYKGNEVEVPANPQKIVYVGSNPGDLLALGVKPAGATLSVIASQIAYPDLIEGITDVGYPYSSEKVLELQPDLIIFDDWDEEGLAALSKIAPTVVVGLDGTFQTKERVGHIADLLGKTKEYEEWFAKYDEKVAATKAKLNLEEGDTATSLLLLGADMYIMGNKGLNTTLFGQLGFTPAKGVDKLVSGNERFIDVSDEVLPDYMGDYVFLLTDSSDETSARQATLTGSGLWKSIPAVKDNHVYTLDSKFNYDDPMTLDRLLDEIVSIMKP
jgi:ABC-type Fe3+-hydroxamate transport system, periplasmic component